MLSDEPDGAAGGGQPDPDFPESGSEGTRTLIVSRDPATGYGLTLGGEQPVYVQTVRRGGAADRAGIRENDVIVKVNNRRVVTEATHHEVVNMIQGRRTGFLLSVSKECGIMSGVFFRIFKKLKEFFP